ATGGAAGNNAAHAIQIGIHVDGAKIVGDGSDPFGFGFGFGARAGYQLRFGDIQVTPELAIDWNRWGISLQGQDLGSAWVLGILPGARVGYSVGAATPWLAFHVGLDHGDGSGDMSQSTDKLGLDVGAGADLAFKSASIGPFVAYNIDFTDNTSIKWLSFGI